MRIAAQEYDPLIALDPEGPEKLAAQSIAYICRNMPDLGALVYSVDDAALVLECYQMYESCSAIIRPLKNRQLLQSGLRFATWQNRQHLQDKLG